MSDGAKLLFIIGKGRSGSTVLGDVLGSFPTVFHMGEVWRLWSHGLLKGHLCSCGSPVRECPIWSRVLGRLTEGGWAWAVDDPEEVVRVQRDLFGFGGIVRSRLVRRHSRSASNYTGLARELYRTVADVTRCDLLIDSSKWAFDPILGDPPEGLTVHALHLVRDPRAVAASWASPKLFPDTGTPMPRFGSVHTALSWLTRTWASERVVATLGERGLTLRFEDILADPVTHIRRIGDLLGFRWELEMIDRKVVVQPGHTIMGNPGRFQHGEVTLREPEAAEPNRIVSLLTFPMRRRFGY